MDLYHDFDWIQTGFGLDSDLNACLDPNKKVPKKYLNEDFMLKNAQELDVLSVGPGASYASSLALGSGVGSGSCPDLYPDPHPGP